MGLTSGIVAGLARLRDDLVQHGRLSALALLAEPTLAGQRDRARDGVQRIEQAARVQEHLRRYFSAREPIIHWPAGSAPGDLGLIPSRGIAQLAPIVAAQAELLASLAAHAQALQLDCARTPLGEPALLLVMEISRTLPEPVASPARRPSRARRAAPGGPRRVLRGPGSVALDPIFEPAFSLLEEPELLKARESYEQAPFYWLAGLRESMAAQLCALCVLEYDGLPLAYYRDFAKQAWDEMRHALFFLELGKTLLPGFLAGAPRGHPLLAGARCFQRIGRGLPCPIERNLYEVAWNATLPQRLVLMHLDTETPGIARFKQELGADAFRGRPLQAEGLRLSTHDEATHARLGRTWLLHLLPERAARRAEVARTRLLRGALLMAAFSNYHQRPFAQLAGLHA